MELRHERPALRLIGYSRADVDQLIGDATEAYEAVWRERADLDDRVHYLEQKLSSVSETEEALRNALITAEKVADERRAQASRDAELVVREAEVRAREILHTAYAERERIRQETENMRGEEAEFRLRLRSLLGTTLQSVRDHEETLVEAAAPAALPEVVSAATQISNEARPGPEE